MQLFSKLKNSFQSAIHNKHLRTGLPFLTFMVLGWLGLREFAQIRYDFKKKLGLASEFQDQVEAMGIKKKEQTSVKEEFENMVAKQDLESWFNIRGPRPDEDSRTIQNQIREQHAREEAEARTS